MKAFIRALCIASAFMGMLGLAGCGPDNETEGARLAKEAGSPGAENPNATKVEPKPVTSQLEHYQNSQNALKAQQGGKKGADATTPKK